MFDLWKSSIPWIQETCDTFEATKPILFWTFDSIWPSELSSAFFPRRRRGCFCYTLRVSDASTARVSVSSGGCATSRGALLGLEAQVTERKPKITRSAATSVHHVLKFSDATKACTQVFEDVYDRRIKKWFNFFEGDKRCVNLKMSQDVNGICCSIERHCKCWGWKEGSSAGHLWNE